MNEKLEWLLWQRTDGELTVEDRKQLEVLLAQEPKARDEENELESIARLLSRVRFEEEEVPAELRPRVLVQVDARQASSRRSQSAVASKSRKGALATGLAALGDAIFKESLMSRKRLALLSAVAVVLVGGVAFLVLSEGFPPKSGLTGAIGGVEKADRYRDTQVTASDVAVEGVGETEAVDKDLVVDPADRGIVGGAGVDRGIVGGAGVDRGGGGAVSSAAAARGVDRGGAGVDRGGAGVDRGGAGVDRGGAGVDRGGAGVDRGGAGVDRGTAGGAGVDRGTAGGAGVDRGTAGGAGVDRGTAGGAGVDRGTAGGAGVDRGTAGGAGVDRGTAGGAGVDRGTAGGAGVDRGTAGGAGVDRGTAGGAGVDRGTAGGAGVDRGTAGGAGVDRGTAGGAGVDRGTAGGAGVDRGTAGGQAKDRG